MSEGHWQLEGNAAELYQRYLVPGITSKWAEDLVHRAQLRPGEDVLDVACGTGVVARLAAQKVASGHVTGLDLNAGMLAVARGVSEGAPVTGWRAALLICHSLPAISMQSSASWDFNSFLISQKPIGRFQGCDFICSLHARWWKVYVPAGSVCRRRMVVSRCRLMADFVANVWRLQRSRPGPPPESSHLVGSVSAPTAL